jgi:hypothetical protein
MPAFCPHQDYLQPSPPGPYAVNSEIRGHAPRGRPLSISRFELGTAGHATPNFVGAAAMSSNPRARNTMS